MSVETERRAIQRHFKEMSRLQTIKSREVMSAAEQSRKAEVARNAASRAASRSSGESKLRDAQRCREKAALHDKKVADIEKKIGAEQRKLSDAQRRLSNAEAREEKKQSRERDHAQRRHQEQIRGISATLTQHGNMHRVALSALARMENLPARITVLFLASNPIDHAQLRLDEEARSIAEMIRKSEYRDAVRFESRWAVRPLDVLQAINELKPRIVHFSGHGSDEEAIVFQDELGEAREVSKEAIAQTMAAASGDIQLVFFNTCYSRGQAQAVVEFVPAAIGMNTSIGDKAARIFSAQFYSSIGFGLSVRSAFDQARVALMLAGIREESTPELFIAPDLDADKLVLVKPGENRKLHGVNT